jgi:L-threonylcarbamoyladenylate synthase
VTTLVLSASAAPDIQRAAELLRCGRLVAFPTETVYGLGARADDAEAVAALVRVKVRPAEKRLTILIPDPEHCRRYAAPLDPKAAALAKAFWPGPLTLVVPDGSGGDVGLRCPDCEVTRRLLRAAGVPVVAPSANLSGLPPARTAGEVLAAFDGRIAAVLDGGSTRIGLPSTVVQVRAQEVRILRAGALREEDVQAALAR